MAKGNDQVFQLSLTELAFTIAFILLLLLGYLVIKEQLKHKDDEEQHAEVQCKERVAVALDTAKSRLAEALMNAGASNPDEVITHLIAAEEVRSERDRLKQRVDDLDAKLTALTELQTKLESAAESSKKDITKEEVTAALTLQDQLKKQLKEELKKELKPGQETQMMREVMIAAKNYNELTKTGLNLTDIRKANDDLKGQVAFLKTRLEARGGLDYPPCWADENGKVEFLFAVELRTDSVIVSPAWPARREADARALPGIDEVLAKRHSYQGFPSRIQSIFDWSKCQTPQCRHYVQIKSVIPDAVQSDRARLMVENYFYKVEARR